MGLKILLDLKGGGGSSVGLKILLDLKGGGGALWDLRYS